MRWLQELERSKEAFAAARERTRPFVTASFAVSSDDCLAQTRGQATRISGPEALRVTHQLRAHHEALVVGVGTVLSDDPALTTRLVEGPSPLRVVLDSSLRVPVTARCLRSTPRAAWLVTSAPASDVRARALAAAGADLIQVPGSKQGVSLSALLSLLAAHGVRSLMLEGGSEVLESFFQEGCVDYLVVTVGARQLDNPRAVRVGPHTRDVLRRWRVASEQTDLGADRLETGPILRSSQAEAGRAPVRRVMAGT